MTFPTFPKDAHDFTSADVGQALAGLIARDSSGMPVEGMLAAPTVGAVASAWKARIGRFVHVSHTSGAIKFSGLKAATDVDIVASAGIPSGQSRIDRVCWNPATEALIVLQGTPATTPVAPAAGALAKVGTVLVKAGDAQVVAAQVSPDFDETSLAAAVNSSQKGSLPHGAGGALLGGNLYTSTTAYVVTFPKPFDAVPGLFAQAAANTASVAQWLQPYEVTRTGFKFRIVSVNAPAVAGVVSWEAWEK